MIAASPTYTTEARGHGPPASGSATDDSETSPLLRPESAQPRSLSERWHSTASGFLDKNAGLLFIAASQLFFCLSSVFIKWLNNSDEHVPMLEVRDTFENMYT